MSSCCWCWKCSKKSPKYDDDTNSTVKVVRTTDSNGSTITKTTITKKSKVHSIGARGQIELQTSSFIESDNKKLNEQPKDDQNPSVSHSQFEMQCLQEHNRLRALHNAPPLKLNRKLSAVAQKWAVHMANSNTMRHSNCNYGENLYMCSGFSIPGSKPVESWYNEIKDYNFRKPGFSSKTGHFTQVVWKDSKELGVGVEVRGNVTWVCANYDPPGNFSDNYEQNVSKPINK